MAQAGRLAAFSAPAAWGEAGPGARPPSAASAPQGRGVSRSGGASAPGRMRKRSPAARTPAQAFGVRRWPRRARLRLVRHLKRPPLSRSLSEGSPSSHDRHQGV